MQVFGIGRYVLMLLITAVVIIGGSSVVRATTASSPNYEITETEFNAGAALDSCSGQYCAQATIGSLSGDSGEGVTTDAEFSPIATDSEPMLEVIIENGESYLGVLEVDKTSTKTMVVKVRNYLSNGYTMHMVGGAPVYDGNYIDTPTEPTASSPGTEQFAINVVKNTTPDIGADPVQVPSEEFSFGQVAPGYGTPNLYKYVDNEVIAQSDSETGQTEYTISMIINVAGSTPAGHYSADYSVIVVPAF